MLRSIKRFTARVRQMSRPAYFILKITLIVSCVYLTSALVLLVSVGSFTARNYEMYLFARYLYSVPQAILLLAVIGSAIVEEQAVKRGS